MPATSVYQVVVRIVSWGDQHSMWKVTKCWRLVCDALPYKYCCQWALTKMGYRKCEGGDGEYGRVDAFLLSSCVKSQRRIMNIFIELSGQRVAFLQDQESKLLFRQPERRWRVPDQRRSIRQYLNNFVHSDGALFKQKLEVYDALKNVFVPT